METGKEKDTHLGPSGDVYPTHVDPTQVEFPKNTTGQTPILESGINEDTPLLAPVPFYHRKKFWTVLVVLVVLIGGGYYAYTQNVFAPAAATVDGTKITKVELAESIRLIEASATQQGINLTDIGAEAEIRAQALDSLINNTLLLNAAKKEGVKVTQDEVDAKYAELVTQIGDGDMLSERMAALGLTEETLRKNIGDRLYADRYLEKVTDIEELTATEQEITAYYDGIPEEAGDIPPLEAIYDGIAAQIVAEKQQQIILDLVASLRDNADIVIKE